MKSAPAAAAPVIVSGKPVSQKTSLKVVDPPGHLNPEADQSAEETQMQQHMVSFEFFGGFGVS